MTRLPDSGDYGKQGGERFRTNQKYPAATDKAMKRTRDNDTSVIRGPATMKAGRLDSYGAVSKPPSDVSHDPGVSRTSTVKQKLISFSYNRTSCLMQLVLIHIRKGV